MEPKVEIAVTKTMTVTLTEEQAATLLRKAVDAPAKAAVNFDCGYGYLRDITITWKENS